MFCDAGMRFKGFSGKLSTCRERKEEGGEEITVQIHYESK